MCYFAEVRARFSGDHELDAAVQLCRHRVCVTVPAGNLRARLQPAEETLDSQISDLRQRLLTQDDGHVASGQFLPTLLLLLQKLVGLAGAASELFVLCVLLGFQKFCVSLSCCKWWIWTVLLNSICLLLCFRRAHAHPPENICALLTRPAGIGKYFLSASRVFTLSVSTDAWQPRIERAGPSRVLQHCWHWGQCSRTFRL